jgi:hypothetical protein
MSGSTSAILNVPPTVYDSITAGQVVVDDMEIVPQRLHLAVERT